MSEGGMRGRGMSGRGMSGTEGAPVVERLASAADLLAVAEGFLVAREAEHSFLLGLASTIGGRPDLSPDAYLAVVREGSEVRLVAMRTPPFHVALSLASDPAAVDVLVADMLGDQPGLSGVMGPTDVARRFVSSWVTGRGTAATLDMAARIYRLERVIPPAVPPAGTWRVAGPADAALLSAWVAAFRIEAIPNQPPGDDPAVLVDRWLADGRRVVYLWEMEGRPVSMVVAGGRTPHGVRIGTVYTPPGERGRGHARALTAAASQDQLDRGRTFCFLDADLANPTSNGVYEAVGYEAVADMEMYRFEPEADG